MVRVRVGVTVFDYDYGVSVCVCDVFGAQWRRGKNKLYFRMCVLYDEYFLIRNKLSQGTLNDVLFNNMLTFCHSSHSNDCSATKIEIISAHD